MTEEELLERAAEERELIVERYKHGRKEGAKIDPWEEATFEVYHILDRYGFVHQEQTRINENPQEIRLEMEREKKWLKMIKHWDNNNEKVKRRMYKGIPNSLRGKVWSKLLNLERAKEEQRGKYQEMRDLAWKWSTDIRQIDLDVNRTYREHIMFRERYNSKQCELFNVLGAYSVYNLEIGYCQGMSQIVALLLMYLDEEDTFWALSALVSDRKFNMHGFFIPGFPKLLRYQEHHDKIMNKFLPKLKKHLDKNGVDTGIYTLKWFFQCFLDRIPFKLTLRVWDVFLLEGERILTCMAYNILKLHRKHILLLGMDDILYFLQVKLAKDFDYTDDLAMESLHKSIEELRKSKLDNSGPAPPNELPKHPFGLFKPNLTFERSVGRRTEFSSVEKLTRDTAVLRREESIREKSNGDISNRHSDISGAEVISVDEEESSILGEAEMEEGSSHKSIAGTSVTSTADVSVLSSVARSDVHSINTVGEEETDHDERDEECVVGGAGPEDTTTPIISPNTSLSPDVVRIYVPYSLPLIKDTTTQNGDFISYNRKENAIRITITEQQSDDIETPVVEQPQNILIESPIIDLK